MRKILILILVPVLVLSCKRNEKNINLKGITVNLHIDRFEKDLFAVDPSQIDSIIPVLRQKYGNFFQIFNYRIIRIGSDESPNYPEYLKKFVTDFTNYKIYKRTEEVFPNLDEVKSDLTNAFRHYSYYFPDKKIPRIVTYISGFNQAVVTDENLLAIGLDDYLGTGEELYRQLGVYDYMVKNMHKERIPTDCMHLWATTEYPFHDSINNLITNMVYEGMVMYFVTKMLPNQSELLTWGFTENQMNFCKNNESQMWTYLIENKLLFNSDRFTIEKFIREGPFTKDFSSESPARAAVWIGYNIVKSYLNNHKKITLKNLMTERNYQGILNSSAYNP